MKKSTSFILMILLSLFLAGNITAETLPNLEKTLNSWQGAREIQLLSEEVDPLGSTELLPLIELFLKHNFAVSTAKEKPVSSKGLLVEIRHMETQNLIVLKRASDQSIIALEKITKNHQAESVAPPAPQVYQARVPQPSPVPSGQQGPISLEGTPVALAWLENEPESDGYLALLSDAGVALYKVQGMQLQKISDIAPPKAGFRPLTLSGGDTNGDGSIELAAVWAEDVYSIYSGTDSNIWSQLFSYEQQKLVPLGLQTGYVRLFDSQGIVQQRGTYSPFFGPVHKLQYRQGKFLTGPSLSWGEQGIFSLTPFGDGSGLAWPEPGKVAVVSLETGEPLPGGTILEDLGRTHTAQIAVRLEEPEYRSGFGSEDKVLEKYISLPPRLVRNDDHSMVTIYRGRKSGTLFFGQPDGEDRLVRLAKKGGGLILDYPFPPVKSFIIDFTIIPGTEGSGVLLLLNEKEDASSQAYLLYQEAAPPY